MTVLEQRIAVVEMCKNLSCADTVADMEWDELCKSLCMINRRNLKLRFDVKLALVDRHARAALESFLEDLGKGDKPDDAKWKLFSDAWELQDKDGVSPFVFDGLAPRLSVIFRDVIQDYESAGFLDGLGEDEDGSGGEGEGERQPETSSAERDALLAQQCKATELRLKLQAQAS